MPGSEPFQAASVASEQFHPLTVQGHPAVSTSQGGVNFGRGVGACRKTAEKLTKSLAISVDKFPTKKFKLQQERGPRGSLAFVLS